ncbi:DUF1254 domain-containing protein [Paraburkholderia sabiae]|uniref:DUF1254 domain-containing protein n=1 Tax=Paraburkholderia sabiae TaxID=273251 RepID=A0ABU9QMJ1_9BURK|nr:DUF1254 domain-containing protein [Paraburkholderia sabiae]WJZ79126.1 DUF1254 domain-containing protein [Paraburkholderia sabiae]
MAQLIICVVTICTVGLSSAADDEPQRRAIQRRGVEAAIWAMPAVNYDLMYEAMVRAEGGNTASNKIVYWSRPGTWRNQTLTPNRDTIYFMPFFDTRRSGPVVLDVPAEGEGTLVGSIDDAWQTALEDVGPAGADKGRGGRYLIVPPGYQKAVPKGFIVLRSSTYAGFALIRSNLRSRNDTDIARAVRYGKRMRLYPLSEADAPRPTRYVDVVNSLFDATIPYDERFFVSLNRVVQSEPWLTRDKVMIDSLKSLGIEKGKPFTPDGARQALLRTAMDEAHAWLSAQYDAQFSNAYYDGERWALPVSVELVKGLGDNFSDPDQYPVDARGVTYTVGFFSAKRLGAGQFYLVTTRDGKGKELDGSKSYRLRVPAHAPASQYWSASVYDRNTHAFRREAAWSSRASNDEKVRREPDGSVELYFGAHAPAGKESNWIPTRSDGKFEVMFRIYGPKKSLYDKTWRMGDIEEVM